MSKPNSQHLFFNGQFINLAFYLFLLTTQFTPVLADNYPIPIPPKDISQYGKHFQRSMTLMATSTPQKRNTVRILFYGQSIIKQLSHSTIVEDLKKRFPHTDFVVANKAIGGFSSQLLVRTLYYDVIPFYPDLLIFQVYGAHDKYEEIIRKVRSLTTAEIIMQSDHANKWPEPKSEQGDFWVQQKKWSDKMNYFLLPAIANRYKCSWQPQRWEWVDYLKDNDLQPQALLKDKVHLNEHGHWLMVNLLKRYLIYLPSEPQDEWHDLVKTYQVGKDIHWQGNRLRLPFTGNRVVAIAGNQAGGTALVLIDGKKPSEHPECYTYTRPSGTSGIGWPAIKKMTWHNPPVLETWEATCSNFNDKQDEFIFTLKGSVTGDDGKGYAKQTFISNSGRIIIKPEDWVFEYDKKVSKKKAPHEFKVRWQVKLMGTDKYIAPQIDALSKEYPIVLASNLENKTHLLELVASDNNKPDIKAIRVHKPPLNESLVPKLYDHAVSQKP
jgi:hypothetical protein